MKAHKARVSVMAAMADGRRRLDRRDVKGALACFDRAIALDALCAQAVLYRAGLRLIAGDGAGAFADFEAMARLDHSVLPAYRDLTTPSAEEFPGLIPAVEALLRERPRCAWAWVFHAFSLRSLMRYEKAIEDLDRAVALEPRSAALLAMRSRVKLTNRQAFYDGVADMEAALRLAPRWGWLHCWLGEALRHRGHFDRALKALDRGLALSPRYLRGFAWRGGVKVALGRHAGAAADLTRSLAFDPIYHHDFEYTADQKSWAYNQRMLARRGRGDAPGALADAVLAHRHGPRYAWVFNPSRDPQVYAAGLAELDAALRKRPRLAWAWAWKGQTRLQSGDLAGALADLERALGLRARLAWPRAWKGRALQLLGRTREALAALDASLAADPSYSPAWGWRGEALRLLGRLPAAEASFSRAIRLDHRAAWAFAGRGECRARRGELAAALNDLDRAVLIHPAYAQAYAWRAEARRLRKDWAGSIRDAGLALKLKPDLVGAYLTRSLARGGLKDYAGQVRDFRKAERLSPGLRRVPVSPA